MTSYNYLGYGVTDSNGVAHLDHDAQGQEIEHSYTGTGAGEIDVVASLDNPVSSGSIVSVPCNVLDTIFFDNAIDDSKASSYVNSDTTNTEISYSNDGTTITRTLASYSTWYDVKIGNSTEWRDSSIDYCIEFDVIFTKPSGSNGNAFLLFGDGSVSLGGIMDSTGAGHVKLETDGTALKAYWKGTHISARDTTMTSNKGFRFQIYNNCSCTFKNLRIYPI